MNINSINKKNIEMKVNVVESRTAQGKYLIVFGYVSFPIRLQACAALQAKAHVAFFLMTQFF